MLPQSERVPSSFVGPGGEPSTPPGKLQWKPFQWVSVPIMARLVKRYLLSDFQQINDSLILHRSIQPVTSADALLRAVKVLYDALDLSGAGRVARLTVPSGKRIYPLQMRRNVTVAVGGISVYDTSTAMRMDLVTAQTAVINYLFPPGAFLDEGDIVEAAGTGNGGDAAVGVGLWYLEEDSF